MTDARRGTRRPDTLDERILRLLVRVRCPTSPGATTSSSGSGGLPGVIGTETRPGLREVFRR